MTDKEIEALAKKLNYSSLGAYNKSTAQAKAIGAQRAEEKAALPAVPEIVKDLTMKTAMDMQKKKEDAFDRIEVAPAKPKQHPKPMSEEDRRNQAKKQYEDYVSSEEHRTNLEEATRKQTEERQKKIVPGTNSSDWYVPAKDDKEVRLREEMERAEAQYNASEDRKVMASDLAEIEAMDENDRALLEEYIRLRDNLENEAGVPYAQLVAKYGVEKTKELASSYGRNLHEKQAMDVVADTAADMNTVSKTIGHNIKGIGARVFGGIPGMIGRVDEALNKDDRYKTLATYTAGDLPGLYGSTVMQETAKDITGDVYDEEGNLVKDGGKLRQLGAWAYQGAMSAADNAGRLVLSGGSSGISSALAASSTFTQSVQQYSAQGANPEQAYTAATLSAGIEYITEKMTTDETLKLFRSGGDPGAWKKVLTQTFLVEPTSEEVNLFANLAMETAMLGEKSRKEQRIGDLIAGGMTRDQAELQFWKEMGNEALNTYAVSAFGGLFSNAGAAYAGSLMQGGQEQQMLMEPAAPVQQEGPEAAIVQQDAQPHVPTEAELAQLAMEDTVAGLQETAPEAAPAALMTEQQQSLQMAMEDLMGGQEQQEQTPVPDPRLAEMQKLDADRAVNRQRQQDVYEELQSAKRHQRDQQKEIARAEQKLQDTGKGSQARINQMKTELEQQDNLVAQLESQNTYFTGDYERTLEEAVAQQEAVFENAREEAQQAIADHEAGLITDSQLQAAQEKYNTAGQEVYRLKHMSQEQYAAELAEVGLVADRPVTQKTAQKLKPAAETVQEAAPAMEVAQDPVTATADDQEAVGDNLKATENSPQEGDNGNLPPADGQDTDGNGPDFRASNTYMVTGLHSENQNIRAGYQQELRENPDAALYPVKHNADTLAEAQSRTGSQEKNTAALDAILSKEHWTAEDVATSTLLMDQIMESGDPDAIAKLGALRQKRKTEGTRMGQEVQSFAINNPTMKTAESPATAVDTFRARVDGLTKEESTWNPRSGMEFETWKENLFRDVDRIGIAIATVEDGDTESMRQIIRQIAQRRKTTAWFGTSDNLTGTAWNILKKMDFQDLKKIANTQLVAMADDYRARTRGEVVKSLRKQSMLSSLKTFNRNISGNSVVGLADAVSDSSSGRLADTVLSRFTGKRTMGNDLARAGTYLKAAKEAGQFASLCVELNIPIETDIEGSFEAAAGKGGNNKYMGKTFRATGNPAMRALYAYQKYMSYALEVTDKIFEGGTNAAVAESLNRLQNSGLTEEDAAALEDYVGNRRTFKNASWKDTGSDGNAVERGSELARLADSTKNLGGNTRTGKVVQGALDVAMPFTSVPMNVAQTGIDYTAGVVKGLGEMVEVIKDARAGKTIPVERQRQAASDFGRGVTGTGMIALFASAAAMGALKNSNDDDWDKEALAQAEGRSGAQINWDALMRGLQGGDAAWKAGDTVSGMDFLEPFNTLMYLGYELSQADDFNLLTGAGATVKSVLQSLMDSPVMTGLADIEQTLNDISKAETFGDKFNVAAGYAGDVASSFVPQWMRQTAQHTDGYYRDTRGDNALESAINSFTAAIPGLSQNLPKKYSGLGEVQERGGPAEIFLDPTATHKYQPNEVTEFLDELSARAGTEADGIYPDRQAPMKFTFADGKEVKLDGAMRETYQKTYGEKVNELYMSLKNDPDFQGLSDELQIKSLKEAKSIAEKYAKASVSDFREVPEGTTEELTREILEKETRGRLSGLFGDLEIQREYGYSSEQTAADLEESFRTFQGMTPQAQKDILDKATGDTARYLEVRQKGVTTDEFLQATEAINALEPRPGNDEVKPIQQWKVIEGMEGLSDRSRDALMRAWMSDSEAEKYFTVRRQGVSTKEFVAAASSIDQLKPEPGYKTVRDIQQWEVVGNIAGSDSAKDALMKMYMPDYDPADRSPVKTELKYDYARQELGLTPKQFVEVYEVSTSGKKDEKLAAWQEMGYSREEANMFYRLFSATGKTKIDVVDWYEGK